MPELPEVESVKRGLEVLIGQKVKQIDVLDSWLRRPVPSNLRQLIGTTLTNIERRAKYIILSFDDLKLVCHLGMTGRMAFRNHSEKHDKVQFDFESKTLFFNDSRRFGFIDWLNQIDFSHVGLEPLSGSFYAKDLIALAAKSREATKIFLLDQSKVAGLGNIYACEALYRAKISPFRPINSLSEAELTALHQAIIDTLSLAVEKGGSTLRDYRGVDGRTGDFQNEFLVYDRAGRPCTSHPNCPGILRVKQAGRSTYYCPVVQQ